MSWSRIYEGLLSYTGLSASSVLLALALTYTFNRALEKWRLNHLPPGPPRGWVIGNTIPQALYAVSLLGSRSHTHILTARTGISKSGRRHMGLSSASGKACRPSSSSTVSTPRSRSWKKKVLIWPIDLDLLLRERCSRVECGCYSHRRASGLRKCASKLFTLQKLPLEPCL